MEVPQKTKIMASSPITSWQIDGEKVETVTDFLFLGSKITADSDCSHEIILCIFSRCGARMGFLTRYNGELRVSTRSPVSPP